LQNLIQKAFLLQFLNDLVAIQFVELWILGNSAFESIEELMLLEVLLDGAFDLVHLSVGDSRFLLVRLTSSCRAGNVLRHTCYSLQSIYI